MTSSIPIERHKIYPPEPPDDWTLIIIVNKGCCSGGRTVMTSRELSEPELCPTDLIVWKTV